MDRADQTVRDALHRWGIEHEVVPCDPALADTAAFCEHYGYSLDESANTILVHGKGEPPRFAACVVLATTRLDVNGAVRRRLGVRKASFADAGVTRQVTGMEIGGVTAFGLPDDLPLWIDARVMDRERVILGGGGRSWKVLLAPSELGKLPHAEVVAELAKQPGA